MALHSHGHWLEVETIGDVAVARFTRRRILQEESVQAAGEQLLGLTEDTGCRKVVLNFSKVQGMTTSLLGKLVATHRKLEKVGGRLVLCEVGPSLEEIFTLCGLPRLVPVYAQEQEALQSF